MSAEASTRSKNRPIASPRTASAKFGGAIAGTGFGLSKAGAGTLKLRGASTYTGATTVSAGTLAVKGSLANTATSVASASSARLQGSGLMVGLNSGPHAGITSRIHGNHQTIPRP